MQAYSGEGPQPTAVISQAERVQWGQRQLVIFFCHYYYYLFIKRKQQQQSKTKQKAYKETRKPFFATKHKCYLGFFSPQTNLKAFLSIWGNLEEI